MLPDESGSRHVFNSLSDRLTATFKNLRGKGRLTEADIDATAREIRRALLDADVAVPVVRAFTAAVKERAAGGCQVLGLRYAKDPAVGTRFDTLSRELGDAFLRVDLDGKGHSTVTEHRSQEAVDRVLSFFGDKLSG